MGAVWGPSRQCRVVGQDGRRDGGKDKALSLEGRRRGQEDGLPAVTCFEYMQDAPCRPFRPHTGSLQFATHGLVAGIPIQATIKHIGFFKIEGTGNTL